MKENLRRLTHMSITDVITAIGVVVAALTFLETVRRYLRDQFQQQAARTREELQAIIGDCGLFLRPLNQKFPYPILHTATAITKEFCSRMGQSPGPEDVHRLLKNKELLRSICVDGWISSTQILRMMDIVEKLERKASSRNLQGRLLLIREATLLLAGIVAEICSHESFYAMLYQLELESNCEDEVADLLNTITVELQLGICKIFNDKYKNKIERSLYFIQKSASMFIGLTDQQLKHLSETDEEHAHFIQKAANMFINLKDRTLRYLAKSQEVQPIETNPNGMDEDPIIKIKHEGSPLSHFKKVKSILGDVRQDIGESNYHKLCKLIEPLKTMCEQIEQLPENSQEELVLVNAY
jgi:hypothetical protein